MKKLYILFLFSVTAFLCIQIALAMDATLPRWILFYANDFLCLPIVLFLCLVTVQRIKKNKNIRLSLFTVFSLVAFYSFYFEVYLAQNHPRYTADVVDVLMYSSGGLLFYLLQKKKLKTQER